MEKTQRPYQQKEAKNGRTADRGITAEEGTRGRIRDGGTIKEHAAAGEAADDQKIDACRKNCSGKQYCHLCGGTSRAAVFCFGGYRDAVDAGHDEAGNDQAGPCQVCDLCGGRSVFLDDLYSLPE